MKRWIPLAMITVSCQDYSDLRSELEVQKVELQSQRQEIAKFQTTLEYLSQELSDTRYLAAFGYSPNGGFGVSCDGSQVTRGTLGEAAYRALKQTQLCHPKEGK